MGAAVTNFNFRTSLDLTLVYEGGYVNHPRDPGGPTNKGITQRTFNDYRNVVGMPPKDVRNINPGEVAEIYRKQYWDAVKGDTLGDGLDYCVFDFAVNSGVTRAIRYLQASVGARADGHIGMGTLAAIADMKAEDIIAKICANRMAFLKGLATFDTFGKGWTRRVVGKIEGAQTTDCGVLDYAMNMADNARVGRKGLDLAPPKPIGELPGEVAAKAECDDMAYMPLRPMSYAELKAGRWA